MESYEKIKEGEKDKKRQFSSKSVVEHVWRGVLAYFRHVRSGNFSPSSLFTFQSIAKKVHDAIFDESLITVNMDADDDLAQ